MSMFFFVYICGLFANQGLEEQNKEMHEKNWKDRTGQWDARQKCEYFQLEKVYRRKDHVHFKKIVYSFRKCFLLFLNFLW